MPSFSSMDGGVYRRPKVQEFPCKFVEKPTLRYHKQADPNIKEELESNLEYAQQFMLLLIEIYHNEIEEFRKQKCFPVPDDVNAFTKKYLEECDIVSCFVKDNYDQTGQQEDVQSTDDMFTLFKSYAKEVVADKSKDIKWFRKQLKNNYKIDRCKKGVYRDHWVTYGLKEKEKDCMIDDKNEVAE